MLPRSRLRRSLEMRQEVELGRDGEGTSAGEDAAGGNPSLRGKTKRGRWVVEERTGSMKIVFFNLAQ